jgi:translation initiation factor 2-alpha kinase 4
MGAMTPQSTARKAKWADTIRRQLREGGVSSYVVEKLQTVEKRFSGTADESLARLRGALPSCDATSAAFDELSMFLGFLRVWGIEKVVNFDALMSPTEDYFDAIYFQIHVKKASSSSSMRDTVQPFCLAVGGCYDRLLHKYWPPKSAYTAPGMVGLSIAVQKLIAMTTSERSQNVETGTEVLVCSRGGGGLLAERMQVVALLWASNIKAEYMCSPAPSMTEHHAYANEHGIKWFVILTEAALTHQKSVKVRHLENKIDEEIKLENLVQYFIENLGTSNSLKKRISQRHS